jgi:hypothetical protein
MWQRQTFAAWAAAIRSGAEAVEEWEEDWSPLPLRITLAPFLGLGAGKLGDEGWGEGTWNEWVVGCSCW